MDECGVMHMRKKDVKGLNRFVVNGEAVQKVVEYRCLGCITH